MNPTFIEKSFTLVGIGCEIDLSSNFSDVLGHLWETIHSRREEISSRILPEVWVGYWFIRQSPTPACCYFASLEVDNPENIPERLSLKTIPNSLYAVFQEKQRGEIGGPGGYAYKTWLPESDYVVNTEVPGDLEIYRFTEESGPRSECEILIPVIPKE